MGSGLRRDDFHKVYNGRKLLFDFGTSDYSTSLKWLVDKYADNGVNFDAIWAWELRNLNPREYWAEVPANIKPVLHVSMPLMQMQQHRDYAAFTISTFTLPAAI